MAYCGVLYRPQQGFDHRGRSRGHHILTLWGRDTGGWESKYETGRAGRNTAGGGHCGKNSGCWSDGYGSALSYTAQAVVERQVQLVDAVVQTRGLVLCRIYSWNISHIVTGRICPGHATPLGSLYGPEMSERGYSKGSHRIPNQIAPLPPPVPLSQPCV